MTLLSCNQVERAEAWWKYAQKEYLQYQASKTAPSPINITTASAKILESTVNQSIKERVIHAFSRKQMAAAATIFFVAVVVILVATIALAGTVGLTPLLTISASVAAGLAFISLVGYAYNRHHLYRIFADAHFQTTLTCDTRPRSTSPFVIFLDIDGVLYNTPNQDSVSAKVEELFPNAQTHDHMMCSIAAAYFFNQKALNNLDSIINGIEKTRKASVVISSSWREGISVEELRKTFFGIYNFSKYIIDKTPETLPKQGVGNHSHCRAAEIQYWLTQHPEVVDYLVLDDNDDHLSATFGKKFVRTNYSSLLTDEIAAEILTNCI